VDRISIGTFSPFNYFQSFSRLSKLTLSVALLAIGLFTLGHLSASSPTQKIDCLCVLYDAGETAALTPVLQKWEREGRDFRVLVMGTAMTLVKPEMFPGRRLVLSDLGVEEQVDAGTARTTELSLASLKRITQLQPRSVLTGTASFIQAQLLETYSEARTCAFIDNFYYAPGSIVYGTMEKVQAAAKEVLCPSQQIISELQSHTSPSTHYHVVGKPTLEIWKREIAQVDRNQAIAKSGLPDQGGPIVLFIGGYGNEYDVVNPLYDQYAAQLRACGYRVILQPHPKVAPAPLKMVEALALADYVVGFNSSVILDSALIGKNALYLVPSNLSYSHFAISQGLISKVSDFGQLISYIESRKEPTEVRIELSLPDNSIDLISNLVLGE